MKSPPAMKRPPCPKHGGLNMISEVRLPRHGEDVDMMRLLTAFRFRMFPAGKQGKRKVESAMDSENR